MAGLHTHTLTIFIAAVYFVSTSWLLPFDLYIRLIHRDVLNVMAYIGVENRVDECPVLLLMQRICSAELTHAEII